MPSLYHIVGYFFLNLGPGNKDLCFNFAAWRRNATSCLAWGGNYSKHGRTRIHWKGTSAKAGRSAIGLYLSMSPCTSLLPRWDISREEVTSEARPAFRAYRWRPPSVRYLLGGGQSIARSWYTFIYFLHYTGHINESQPGRTHWCNLINEPHLGDMLKLDIFQLYSA